MRETILKILLLFVILLSSCDEPPTIETARNDFRNSEYAYLVKALKYETCKLVSERITETPGPDESWRIFDITYEMHCPDGETIIKKVRLNYEYMINPKYGLFGWKGPYLQYTQQQEKDYAKE